MFLLLNSHGWECKKSVCLLNFQGLYLLGLPQDLARMEGRGQLCLGMGSRLGRRLTEEEVASWGVLRLFPASFETTSCQDWPEDPSEALQRGRKEEGRRTFSAKGSWLGGDLASDMCAPSATHLRALAKHSSWFCPSSVHYEGLSPPLGPIPCVTAHWLGAL